MSRVVATCVIVMLVGVAASNHGVAVGTGRAGAGAIAPPAQASGADVAWEAFAYDDLLRRRGEAGRPYLPFLDVSTLSTGLYVLAAGAEDTQQPHGRDEVYYVVEGRAVIEVDGERRPVAPGDVIFVKAEIDHRFVDIEEQLQVLVFFAGAAGQ